jgi:hypothetical protein
MTSGTVNVDTLVETVTEALDGGVPLLHREDRKARRDTAEAALSDLAARARANEAELDAAQFLRGLADAGHDNWRARAEAAEADRDRANALLHECEGVIFEGVREDALTVTGCDSWDELMEDADEVRWRVLGHLGIKVVDRSEHFAERLGRADRLARRVAELQAVLREWVWQEESEGRKVPASVDDALAGDGGGA